MILCVCRRVTERQVDSAIAKGARTVEALVAATGAGTDCGACREALAERLCRHPAAEESRAGEQELSG